MDDAKFLELLSEGKTPLTLCADGLPPQAHEPIFERMRFVAHLCQGYMRLYNRVRILEKTRKPQDRLRSEVTDW